MCLSQSNQCDLRSGPGCRARGRKKRGFRRGVNQGELRTNDAQGGLVGLKVKTSDCCVGRFSGRLDHFSLSHLTDGGWVGRNACGWASSPKKSPTCCGSERRCSQFETNQHFDTTSHPKLDSGVRDAREACLRWARRVNHRLLARAVGKAVQLGKLCSPAPVVVTF